MNTLDKISAWILALAFVAGFATLATISTGQIAKAKQHTNYTDVAK